MNQKTLNIIIIGLFIYLIYQIRCIKKEQFSYQEPTQAIKNLGKLAKQLTTGGLTIPGNVNIKGKLVVEHPQTLNTDGFALQVVGRSSLSDVDVKNLNTTYETVVNNLNVKGAASITKKLNAYSDLHVNGNVGIKAAPNSKYPLNITGNVSLHNLKASGDITTEGKFKGSGAVNKSSVPW